MSHWGKGDKAVAAAKFLKILKLYVYANHNFLNATHVCMLLMI